MIFMFRKLDLKPISYHFCLDEINRTWTNVKVVMQGGEFVIFVSWCSSWIFILLWRTKSACGQVGMTIAALFGWLFGSQMRCWNSADLILRYTVHFRSLLIRVKFFSSPQFWNNFSFLVPDSEIDFSFPVPLFWDTQKFRFILILKLWKKRTMP